MRAEKNDGILHKPVGGFLRKEIKADFLKRELHVPAALKRDIAIPDVLKRELPVGDFLGREITLRRRKDSVDQVICFACGRQTPATVSRCLHCEAMIEAPEEASIASTEPTPMYFQESVCLIDMDW